MSIDVSRWINRRLRVQPGLLINDLSNKLYGLPEMIWELARNGAVACMADPNRWTPESTHVEVAIVHGHPLCRSGRSLLIYDKGTGFTDANIERFFDLGAPLQEEEGRNDGASQKRIGRMAMFSLGGEGKRRADRMDLPVYLLTRTASRGPVIMLKLTARGLCEGTINAREIRGDSNELGSYKDRSGSFSLFVIPDTVFQNDDEARAALAYRIPRLRDRAINLLVGGKKLEAPPLAKHSTEAGSIKIYLERVSSEHLDGGLWLCDAGSGLRCAFAPKMSKYVPYPLYHHNLAGDIFIPGLLRHQGTDRATLDNEYLSSPEWQKYLDVLRLHIAPFAQSFLNDDDVFDRKDPATKAWQSLADMFTACYGAPSITGAITGLELNPDRPKNPTGGTGKPGGSNGGANPDGSSKPRPPKPRGIPLRIDGKDYLLMKIFPSIDPQIFGIIGANEQVIQWNTGYGLTRCLTGPAAVEHMVLRLLDVVTCHDEPSDYEMRQKRVSRIRKELFDAGKRKRKPK